MTRLSAAAALVATVLTFLFSAGASAQIGPQDYPAKPIRLIVPFPPGGGSDVLARFIAQELAKAIGQQIVVDNRAGAAGSIGAEMVAKSPADGYTILSTYSGILVINPRIVKQSSFSERDFDPVILLVSVPMMAVIHPSLPIHTTAELIAYAKANPGKLNYGSSGSGAYNHLAGELFNKMAGTKLTHIPFKGGAPAATALLGGQIDLMFTDPTAHLANVKAGKVRALGVTSSTPAVTMPGLRPIAESGVPGYDIISWNGFTMPAGTPPQIIKYLNSELNKILARTDVRQRLIESGYVPVGGTSEDFGHLIRTEIAKWGPIIKDLNIKVD